MANRCIEMNCQQVASMPLRFHGTGKEPAWVVNPDPVWFPNGIADAIYAATWSFYAWGDAFLYVTTRYENGYPRGWTVLDPSQVTVEVSGGRRRYFSQERRLNWEDVVQISRNPRGGLRGTPAFKAYSSQILGMQAATELGRTMMATGTPTAVLKPKRKTNPTQARQIQADWVAAVSNRRGAPAVLPPEIDFEQLAFSPNDLLLMDTQQFYASIIASGCTVPAQMLNLPIEGGLTYQSPSMLFDFWWRAELRPIAYRLSEAMGAQMLPAGNAVTFDARSLTAPNWSEFADRLIQMVEKGQLDAGLLPVMLFGIEPGEDAAKAIIDPASAGASPAQDPNSTVVSIRPTAVN